MGRRVGIFVVVVIVGIGLGMFCAHWLLAPLEEAFRIHNKWVQILVSILSFICPSVAYLTWVRRWDTVSFRLRKKTGYIYAFVAYILTAFVLMLGVTIASSEWISLLKSSYPILESIQVKNTEMLRYFLASGSDYEWWLNMVMIAIIPALGEELFFRVALHDVIGHVVSNTHVLAIITAVMFSIPHLNVDGFLPIIVIGMLLSYLWQYTHSFFLVFIIHFANNLIALMANDAGINPNATPQGTPYYYGILLLLIGVLSLNILLKKLRKMDMYSE